MSTRSIKSFFSKSLSVPKSDFPPVLAASSSPLKRKRSDAEIIDEPLTDRASNSSNKSLRTLDKIGAASNNSSINNSDSSVSINTSCDDTTNVAVQSSSAPESIFAALSEEWKNKLSSELKKSYIKSLDSFVSGEYRNHVTYPPKPDIFYALNSCPLSEIKVVILGQDPYHGPNQVN